MNDLPDKEPIQEPEELWTRAGGQPMYVPSVRPPLTRQDRSTPSKFRRQPADPMKPTNPSDDRTTSLRGK